MELAYAGELVRIRPFADKAECSGLFTALSLEEHDQWQPSWWPGPRVERQFEATGKVSMDKGYSCLAVDRLDTGELIGYEVVKFPRPGQLRADIGTVLLRKHWHRGFGREAKLLAMTLAFENTIALAVTAGTLESHTRARAGLEAVGMKLDGILKRLAFSRGRFVGVAEYSIRREDWEQLGIRRKVKRGKPSWN